MSRNASLYVADMIEACERVVAYSEGFDAAALRSDVRTVDAIVQNLEVLGEAAKRVSPEHNARAPKIHGERLRECATCSSTTTSASIWTSSVTPRW